QDLLYRLDIIRLRIPPLRERAEDIVPLALFFFGEYARKYNRPTPELEKQAVRMLESYPWPGNVRELKNLAERVMIRHRDCQMITEELLRREGLGEVETPAKEVSPLIMNFEESASLEEIEKKAIINALERVGWVQSEAAKLLQISPDRMHTRIKKYGLHHPSWRIHRSNK
ncbi:MAG: helix-turn-helix domain-containing protein, partial [Candidatus Hinthialibacter sp.]